MKINRIISANNINFSARYDAETSKLLKTAGFIFDNMPDSSETLSVIKDGKDLGLIKRIDNKNVCLSRFMNGGIMLQVADDTNEIVDVYYHNTGDTYSDKFCKYKDNKIFPWFAGKDIKLFSKRIKSMSRQEFEGVKTMLKKYIPEFAAGIKTLAR